MSKALKTSPSALMRIADDFVAYAVDSAVVLWGTAFDAAVEEAVRDAKTTASAEAKQRQVVRRWIPSIRRHR